MVNFGETIRITIAKSDLANRKRRHTNYYDQAGYIMMITGYSQQSEILYMSTTSPDWVGLRGLKAL